MAVFDNWPVIDLTAVNLGEFLEEIKKLKQRVEEMEAAISYQLPVATSSTLGGVKSGGDITVNQSYGDSKGKVTVNHAAEAGNVKWENVTGKQQATTEKAGIVTIGEGLRINPNSGKVEVTGQAVSSVSWDAVENKPVATSEVLGIVRVGDGINVTNEGIISTNWSEYQLPTASTTAKGVVSIGEGVSVSENGEISVTPYILPTSSENQKGGIKITAPFKTGGTDSEFLQIDHASSTSYGVVRTSNGIKNTDGVIEVLTATTANKGLVQLPSNGTITSSNGVISVPHATSSVQGGVILGTGLLNDSNNITYVRQATTGQTGIVRPYSNSFAVNASDGVMTMKGASQSYFGGVKAWVSGTTLNIQTT